MEKVTIPSGHHVFITNNGNPRVYENNWPFAALVTLLHVGTIFSEKGLATAELLAAVEERSGKSCDAGVASTTLNKYASEKMIKREVEGKRTYRISIHEGVIPRVLWDRLQPHLTWPDGTPEEIIESDVHQDPFMSQMATAWKQGVMYPQPLTLVSALDNLVSAVMDLKDLLVPAEINEPISSNPTESTAEINQLRQRNRELTAELNRMSRAFRTLPTSVATKEVEVKEDRPGLNLYSLGIKDARYRILVRHAYDNGFDVKVTKKNHIQMFPPDRGKEIVVTGLTPSDTRAYDNFYADLVRAGMPKMA